MRRTASFGVFCVKIRPGALAVASYKNPQKTNTFWCATWRAKSRMRGNETPGRIVTNFCTGVGVHDVITSANFYDFHVRGFGAAGGQILGFSIDVPPCLTSPHFGPPSLSSQMALSWTVNMRPVFTQRKSLCCTHIQGVSKK